MFDDEVNGELKKYPDIILHLPDSRDIIIDSRSHSVLGKNIAILKIN